jgi:epsilon-lactone hydrolase
MASEGLAKIIETLKSRPPTTDLAEQRARMETMAAPAPDDVLITPADANGVAGEWVSAPNAGTGIVLYLHGGGYVIGSPRTHRELASRISRASGARLLVIDYRLAPEHPFPAAVDDAVTAYRWLLAQGLDPANIAIAGDSAGGGLTLATLVRLRDEGVPLPACGVTLSAWTDLEGTGESMTTRAAADPMVGREGLGQMSGSYAAGNLRHPHAAPLYAEMAGLPPLLMQVGDAEVLLDDTTRVVERVRAAGGRVEVEIYPEMIHVFQAFAHFLPEGQQAIERIGAFVKAHTAEPARR